MDAAQILLLSVISLLTLLIVFLGVQVFFILKELRKSVEKINKVLDETSSITENVAKPLSDISSVLSGIKTGVSILSMFSGKRKHKGEENA